MYLIQVYIQTVLYFSFITTALKHFPTAFKNNCENHQPALENGAFASQSFYSVPNVHQEFSSAWNKSLHSHTMIRVASGALGNLFGTEAGHAPLEVIEYSSG